MSESFIIPAELETRLEKIENILLWMQTPDFRIRILEDRCRKVAKYLDIDDKDIPERLKIIVRL